jgi:ferredoxin-NADP reductase
VTPKLLWQPATVVAIEPRTPTVKSFFFRLAQPVGFTAGQHMDVRLTAADGYQAQRSYSIASAPETDHSIELAIERLQDGGLAFLPRHRGGGRRDRAARPDRRPLHVVGG